MVNIPDGEQVLVGTFSLNGRPVIILFYSGASHDFISKACTQKHQLAIEYILTPYMISTQEEKSSRFSSSVGCSFIYLFSPPAPGAPRGRCRSPEPSRCRWPPPRRRRSHLTVT
jgi:hypothetical protein